MIPKVQATNLIEIYFFVCEKYENQLKYSCQRYSNNNNPEFTDQEIMTIYLFVIHQMHLTKTKLIHRFAKDYMLSWFPKLPSYTAFNNRLNRLSEAFRQLTSILLEEFRPETCIDNESLIDSLPIITCAGKRNGKVATEITDKGYCSTKSQYFYGLKLHAIGFRCNNHMPFPEHIILTPASENDLNVYRNDWSNISNRTFYGDKIYHNEDFFHSQLQNRNTQMLTPVKLVPKQSTWERQFNKAADDIFSRYVSKIRQPIEALFNWMIEKTDFQRAGKVRSIKGLLVHVFGKIAAAYIYLIFNP